ncbi:MAG: hypothetical protein AB1641_09085 [Thermodesulfobacteriota bacterium]
MANTSDFYKRFVVSCYSRSSLRILSREDFKKAARFSIKPDEIENIWPALDELVADGAIEYLPATESYRIKRFNVG